MVDIVFHSTFCWPPPLYPEHGMTYYSTSCGTVKILVNGFFVCPALALCINKTLRVSPQVSSELLLNLHIDTKPWQIIIPTESVSQIFTASEMLPENGNVITRKFTYFMWQDNIYLFLVHFHCKWKHFWQDVNMTDCGDPIRC